MLPVPSFEPESAREPREDSAPIFIVGCQRSGTSLLRRILDSHSRIACPPESKFILPLVSVLRSTQAMSGLESMGYGREEVLRALRRFIAAFFEGYAEASGKARWADKTPIYVDCLPEVWDLFGSNARFLLIVRHGLDVAYSLSDPHRDYPAIRKHVEEEGGNVPVAAGRFWSAQNRKIERFRSQHSAACLRLRYEDLTGSPQPTLKSVFEFLDEDWEPTVLQYDRFPHHSGQEDPDVRRRRRIEQNSGRYLAWPPEVIEAVRSACEPMLERLGYG